MTAIIEARDLSKWFGEVVALNDVQVDIGPGVTGLLGPNGAGKSTFIKLALGLYSPSRGAMRLLGAAPRNNMKTLSQIAYCPEFDQFYENMTGYEFVYWLARYQGMRHGPAKKATEEACEQTGMAGRMHDSIDTYSKGMRQRIKIAQSLTHSAAIYLFDEPMAGLDPQGREEMFALIRSLGEGGRAVLVSSHILYEVERVTDQVIFIHEGAILAEGKVREIRDLIRDHPHTIAVECSSPRDLAGQFVGDDGVSRLDVSNGRMEIRTTDPSACYGKLTQLGAAPEAGIQSITCEDDSLQAVFDYLVK